jgi:osmotically-inducible protein OsmY
VNEALTWDPDIDATDVEVRVERGEVWLTGEVDGRHERLLAERCAEGVPGVDYVHNRLRPRSSAEWRRTPGSSRSRPA